MAIDGAMRNKLEPGTRLVARYKGEQHAAELMAGEDGKVRYRLADGREFKSPSAAGSAVMGGRACNGWRFWSLEADQPAEIVPPTRAAAPTAEAAAPKARPRCERCGKQFVGAAQLAHHEANAKRLCVAA